MAPVTRKSNKNKKVVPSAATRKKRYVSKKNHGKGTTSSVVSTSPIPPRRATAAAPTVSFFETPTDPPVSTSELPDAPSPNSSSNRKSDQESVSENSANTTDWLNPAAVSSLISTSDVVIGDSNLRIQNLHSATVRYVNAKNSAYAKFFKAISQHPTLHHLAEEVDDPECSDGSKEHRLVILCRGTKTKAKYNILNSALLVTAKNVKLLSHRHIDLAKR